MKPRRLIGRVAVVTGGSEGLGFAIAKRFIEEGASVAICSIDPVPLAISTDEISKIVEPGQGFFSATCDVSNPADVDLFFQRVLERFSTVQILVNNAGIAGPLGQTDAVSWDDWVQTIHVNLLGTVYCCRKVIPEFTRNGYGKIINLSGGGATSPMPGISAYATSKAAVVRFSETLAVELKGIGVDVNSIAPGALKTSLTDRFIEAGPEKVGEGFYTKLIDSLKDGGTPLDIASNCIVFLASADSDGISGKLIAARWDPWEDFNKNREQLENSDIFTLRRVLPEDRGIELK